MPCPSEATGPESVTPGDWAWAGAEARWRPTSSGRQSSAATKPRRRRMQGRGCADGPRPVGTGVRLSEGPGLRRGAERPPSGREDSGGEAGRRGRRPARDGLTARLGSARLGSARLGSARLGSARLGSARLGSARLGSARLGSARLYLHLAMRMSRAATPMTPILRPKRSPARSRLPARTPLDRTSSRSASSSWHRSQVFRQVIRWASNALR